MSGLPCFAILQPVVGDLCLRSASPGMSWVGGAPRGLSEIDPDHRGVGRETALSDHPFAYHLSPPTEACLAPLSLSSHPAFMSGQSKSLNQTDTSPSPHPAPIPASLLSSTDSKPNSEHIERLPLGVTHLPTGLVNDGQSARLFWRQNSEYCSASVLSSSDGRHMESAEIRLLYDASGRRLPSGRASEGERPALLAAPALRELLSVLNPFLGRALLWPPMEVRRLIASLRSWLGGVP